MSSETVKYFTRAQIAEHNSKEKNWFVIHNNVYDVTAFLNEVSWLVDWWCMPIGFWADDEKQEEKLETDNK